MKKKQPVPSPRSHALSVPLERPDGIDVLRALGATDADVDAHYRAMFANDKKYDTDVHAFEYARNAIATPSGSGSKRRRVANALGLSSRNTSSAGVRNALYAAALERDRVAAIRLKLVKAAVLLTGALEEFLETSGTSLAAVLGESFSKFCVDLKKGRLGALARLATGGTIVISLFRPLIVSFVHTYVGSVFTRENLDRILFGREAFGMMVVRVLLMSSTNSPKTRTSIKPLIKTILETMDFDFLYAASSRLYEYAMAYLAGRVESKGSFMCTLCSSSACTGERSSSWTIATAKTAKMPRYASIFKKVVDALEAMAEAHGDRLSWVVHRALAASSSSSSLAVVVDLSKVVPDAVVEAIARRFLAPAVEGRLGLSLDPKKFAWFVREHRSRIRRLLGKNQPSMSLSRMARDLGACVAGVPPPVRNSMRAFFSSSSVGTPNAFCGMCRRMYPRCTRNKTPVGLGLATVLLPQGTTTARTLR